MKSNLQHSDYRIRKLIGTLGLLLPIVLPIAKGEFLASISHYYYHTLSSLIFIIILSSFGLFLLSYRGYKIDTSTEKISDDFLTNIGSEKKLINLCHTAYGVEATVALREKECKKHQKPAREKEET